MQCLGYLASEVMPSSWPWGIPWKGNAILRFLHVMPSSGRNAEKEGKLSSSLCLFLRKLYPS